MDTALVVSSSESYMDLKKILSLNSVVSYNARSIREARIALCDLPYSLLVIDNPLPDGSAREFAIESSRRDDLDIILLANPVVAERVSVGLEKYGIYVISKAVKDTELGIILRNLRVSRRKLSSLGEKNRKLIKRLEEEKTLTRAKCLLALHEGLDEQEAHKTLEKKAMRERITLLESAGAVIMKYSR